MPITIVLADGTKFNPNERTEPMKTENMPTIAIQEAPANGASPRTIAVVAGELEAAISATLRVKALRDELETLLGKKRRAKKVAP